MDTFINELATNNIYLFLIITIIILLVILVIVLTYMINNSNNTAYKEARAMVETLLPEAKEEHYDIEKITKALEQERRNQGDFTSFEQEQEEKAIISYDQLINNVKNKEPELSVKKVTLPDNSPMSHHRASLEALINDPVAPPIDVNPTPLTTTRAYLDDLKLLKNKLK